MYIPFGISDIKLSIYAQLPNRNKKSCKGKGFQGFILLDVICKNLICLNLFNLFNTKKFRFLYMNLKVEVSTKLYL